jgi:WD40 repeat protein
MPKLLSLALVGASLGRERGNLTELGDTRSGKLVRTLKIPGVVRLSSLSEDGALFFTVSPEVQTWDAASGKMVRSFAPEDSELYSAGFSGDSSQIALGWETGRIDIYDVRTGGLIRCLDAGVGGITATAFSPNGSHLVSGNENGTKVWQIRRNSAEPAAILEGHVGSVKSVAFTATGDRVELGGKCPLVSRRPSKRPG